MESPPAAPSDKTKGLDGPTAVAPLDSAESNGATVSFSSSTASVGSQTTLPCLPLDQGASHHFGEYEILDEIARGGMGVVFKARQTRLNRLVALKMILGGQFAGGDAVQRFRAEAEAAANLDHPGIVPVYDVGEHGGLHFFSMGFVDGETLAKRVTGGPLAPKAAAEMARLIAAAVAYAHGKGVIHRDLKPSNVMLDAGGQPRITDFGLAKHLGDDSGLTIDGQVIGTPSYMPPEQAQGRLDQIDARTDVYSLGAILYCLLTGRPPFQAANPGETIRQVIGNEPVAPKKLNSSVPRDLETICLKCLRKERPKRYQTAGELADDLGRWLHQEPIKARRVGWMERSWLWCKRRPAAAASILGIALTIAVVSGVLASQQREAERQLAEERRENDKRRAGSLVENVVNAPAAGVPYAIQLLEPLAEYALPILRLRLADEEADFRHRLHAAECLAKFGEVDAAFLVECIAPAAADECGNIVSALRQAKAQTLPLLESNAGKANDDADWRTKARLAIVALHLGDTSLAADVCKFRPDPVQRTVFIDEYRGWHADVSDIANLRELSDKDLRSALCLAAGGVPDLDAKTIAALQPLLAGWYQTCEDSATHSAAEWALRKFKVGLPALAPGAGRQAPGCWFVDQQGRGFVAILVDSLEDGGRLLAVSTKEETMGQYRPFAASDGLEENNRFDWPADNVNMNDAKRYCNWLSEQTGMPQSDWCYEEQADGQLSPSANFLNLNGYRLPTHPEWLVCCRAGTTTTRYFGDDDRLVGQYVWFSGNVTQPQAVAQLPPNQYGLFDVLGNVSEWCHLTPVDSPQAQTLGYLSGGSFSQDTTLIASDYMAEVEPTLRFPFGGFRLVRTLTAD